MVPIRTPVRPRGPDRYGRPTESKKGSSVAQANGYSMQNRNSGILRSDGIVSTEIKALSSKGGVVTESPVLIIDAMGRYQPERTRIFGPTGW